MGDLGQSVEKSVEKWKSIGGAQSVEPPPASKIDKAGVFPIRLKAEDGASGDIAWLLNVIAPNPKRTRAAPGNFRQVVGEGQRYAHPIVRPLWRRLGRGGSEVGLGGSDGEWREEGRELGDAAYAWR